MNFFYSRFKSLSFGKIALLCLAIGFAAKLLSTDATATIFNRDDVNVETDLYSETQNITPDLLESNTNFKIKRSLEESVQTGEINLDGWIAGTARTSPNGATGSMDALVYWLTESLGGPNLYKAALASTNGQYYASFPGGALGDTVKVVTLAYTNQPVSSIDYVADIGRNMGFSKTAYAQDNPQGIGFSGFSPILPLWKAFRNVAYLFFALIFVFIGLAIMFRVKINPQTIISVQNAIPQVVMALLLVTFSYAIAGFMLDLAYVVMFLLLEVFSSSITQSEDFNTIVTTINELPEGAQIGLALFAAIFPLVVGALSSIAAVMTVPILNLIILIALVYTMLRISILLITTYAKIVFAVIFGPLQLALGAIPGQSGFGKWFKNLLANIAVLPTVFGMFLLSAFFLTYVPLHGGATFIETLKESWGFFAGIFGLTNPVTAPAAGAILSAELVTKMYALIAGVRSISTEEIFRGAFASGWGVLSFGLVPLLGFGTFFLIPKAGEIIRDALQVNPWKYGTGFGEAISPIARPMGAIGASAVKTGTDAAGGAAFGAASSGVKYIGGKIAGGRIKERGRTVSLGADDFDTT